MFAQWKLMKIDEQTHWNATHLLASVCVNTPCTQSCALFYTGEMGMRERMNRQPEMFG